MVFNPILSKSKDKVFLLDVYPKNAKAALTHAEEIVLKKLTKILEGEP